MVDAPGGAQNLLTTDEQRYAIKTWRYLRLAMIVFIVGLAASLAYERAHAPGCFQTSISAYYYTPVHGFFVGTLVAVGACLICIRGNNDAEDALLNLAGMFAPIVALVPTPDPGSCFSISSPAENRDANVSNNMVALLIAAGIAIAIFVGVVLTAKFTDKATMPGIPAFIGFAGTFAAWLLAVIVYNTDHKFFVGKAHYTAAISMFACFLVVVIINAFAYATKNGGRWWLDRYALIAEAMLGTVAFAIAGKGFGFQHWIIWIEGTLIVLFAVFWALQTEELWGEGVR